MTDVTGTTGATPGWEATLERLERDLELAERFLAGGEPSTPEPWRVPALDGPMPDELLPRAREILRRQAVVKESLRAALSSTGRQRAVAERINVGSGPVAPAYVDFSA